MKNQVTTTRNGIRVQDITFKKARRQDEILKELSSENLDVSPNIPIPKSCTPEMVKEFYKQKIQQCSNMEEAKVYSTTILWIDELIRSRKQLLSLLRKTEEHKLEEDL